MLTQIRRNTKPLHHIESLTKSARRHCEDRRRGRAERAGGRCIDVTFIARGKHQAMLRDGLRVQNDASPSLAPRTLGDGSRRAGGSRRPHRRAKSGHRDNSGEAGDRPQTAVVSFQTGVDVVERIAGASVTEHVLGGVGHVAATIEAPGVIR